MNEIFKLSDKLLEDNKKLKEEIDNLRKDNEGLKAAYKIINEKNANQQVKYLEMMIKYEDMTTLVAKPNTKRQPWETLNA